MSDDEAFIAAIREAPHDDALRLVYADWLEERGHAERAEYLRLAHDLTHWPEHDPRCGPASERLLRLRESVDVEWRERVGWRFDLIFAGFTPGKKINCLRALRWATGLGLLEVVDIVEVKPNVIVYGALREDVERLKYQIFHDPSPHCPVSEGDVELEIRPSIESSSRFGGKRS